MTRTTGRTIAVLLVLVAALGAVGAPAGAASAGQSNCTYPYTATDATGTRVTVQSEPETVVTLGPSAAQTMWEIGAREKVVGVTKYASYLAGSESRTNVSGAGRSFVIAEKVVSLDPDLVLAPNIVTNETVAKLRSAGLTVYRFEAAESMADIETKTREIGRLTGACEGAADRVTRMNATLERVREATADTDSPRVLYYMGGGYTAGGGTFIDTIIETAGGTNVAAEAGIHGYGEVSPEVVVARNPQWILKTSDVAPLPATEAYNGTVAVQNDQVLVLNPNYTSQPAPRTVQVVERLAKTFHPEAFAAANETTTATTTAASTTASATSESTTATSTPGIGAVGALLALVLAGRWTTR